nr:glycosyltransferase family 9 protein [Deltaproteobacteria bacterium]
MDLVYKKILIIRLGAVGDVIRTLPALQALRSNLPHAYLAWAVEDRAASLLLNHPDLDEVFVIPRQKWQREPLSLSTYRSASDLLRKIRRARFDYALDFHGLLKSGLITLLSGSAHRYGFSRAFCKEGNHLFTNYHQMLPEYKINRVERNLFLVKALGLNIDDHTPTIPISSEDQMVANAIMSTSGRDGSRLKILIHPGSSPQTPYKRWHWRRYAHLADGIIQRYGATVFFTGAQDEFDTVRQITGQMTESQYVICHTSTLTQLSALIKRCSLYIGNDTAPMHLAAFVGIPVIALFGPTDPTENAPYARNRSVVIRKDVSCNPCRNRRCNDLRCMDAISVDDVLEAVEGILSLRNADQATQIPATPARQ